MELKTRVQLVWGVALLLAGIGVFFVLPERLAQLKAAGRTDFFILFTRLSLYLIAVMLIGGGAMKIYTQVSGKSAGEDEPRR